MQVQQSQEAQKLPSAPIPAVTVNGSLSSVLPQPVGSFKVKLKTVSEKVIDMYC